MTLRLFVKHEYCIIDLQTQTDARTDRQTDIRQTEPKHIVIPTD